MLPGTLGDPRGRAWSKQGRSIGDPLAGQGSGSGSPRPCVLAGCSRGAGPQGGRLAGAGAAARVRKEGSQGYVQARGLQNKALSTSWLPQLTQDCGNGGSDWSHRVGEERPAAGVPSSKGFWNLLSTKSRRGPATGTDSS